jgi:hypothetical protein
MHAAHTSRTRIEPSSGWWHGAPPPMHCAHRRSAQEVHALGGGGAATAAGAAAAVEALEVKDEDEDEDKERAPLPPPPRAEWWPSRCCVLRPDAPDSMDEGVEPVETGD